MVIEISVAIIAFTMLAIVAVLIAFLLKFKNTLNHLQADLHKVSEETASLLSSVSELVKSDLHGVSIETTNLVSQLNDLTSDVKTKSQSLNFLFRPLSFLSGSSSSGDGSEPKKNTIPQLLKWVTTSAILIKTAKEFIKKYGK